MNSPIRVISLTDDDTHVVARVLRVAIYARYSSIGNTPYSTEEQIQRIRGRLDRGQIRSLLGSNIRLEVVEDWVIRDDAQTGRVGREGLDLIQSGIRAKTFDILLVDDISRIYRDLGGTINLYELLLYYGIEGISVSDNISTLEPNSRDLFVFKGYANEHQSKATSKNTMRGLEYRALNGFSTGHVPYGYFSQPTRKVIIKNIEKPSHFEIKNQYEEARVVLRIWTMYAERIGCHSIATALNDDGIPAPRTKSFKQKRWTQQTVWNILNQEKYVGIWRYRQTRVVKDPDRDKLDQQARPKSEWLVTEREDLRIVPKDIEAQVKKRKAEFAAERSAKGGRFANQGNTPKHLFVGSMQCGLCGGNFILVSGKSGGYFGCMNAHREAALPCSNSRTVKMALVETALVDFLRSQLDRPETYEYIAKKYNELMLSKSSDVPQKLAALESAMSETAKAISNYDKFIRSGTWSETIAKSLSDAEETLKRLTAEKSYLQTQLGSNIYITPGVIREKMVRLDEILNKKMVEANQALKRLFPEKITMTPQIVGSKHHYEAAGVLSVFSLMKFRVYDIGSTGGSGLEAEPIPFKLRIGQAKPI